MLHKYTNLLYKDTNPISLSAPNGLNKSNWPLSHCRLNTDTGISFQIINTTIATIAESITWQNMYKKVIKNINQEDKGKR